MGIYYQLEFITAKIFEMSAEAMMNLIQNELKL